MWWSKSVYSLAVSPLNIFSVIYSNASQRLTTINPSTDYATSDCEDEDDFDEISTISEAQRLEDALADLELKDKEIDLLKEEEAKRREELEAKSGELESVAALLEDRVGDIEQKSQECLSITEELQAQSRALEKRLLAQIELTRSSEAQLKKTQAVVDDRNHSIDNLQKRLNTSTSLLDVRTVELQGIRKTLGPQSDSVTDLDAVKLVTALNAEIFQTAAILAESFGSITSRALEGIDNRSACGRVRQMFGPRLVELLRSVPHDENPVLLRVASQACMVVFSDWISAAWHYQMEPAPQFFGEVYRNVWISGSSLLIFPDFPNN